MEQKSMLFVCNPHAGKGNLKADFWGLIDYFTKAGYLVTVHPTQCAGDATKIIASIANNYDLLLLSGGDGTLNEGINGLMALPPETRPLLGYLPAGSTNDFATSLYIPKIPKLAAATVLKGERFTCDIGDFNGKKFAYVAAFGAFTEVSYDTPQQLKNTLGHSAYIIEGIKRLPSLKACQMTVETDTDKIEDMFLYGMVSNSTSVGGIQRNKETIALDDGLFEVVLLRNPKSLVDMQDIMTGMMSGDFSAPVFYSCKTKRVSFQSKDAIDWTLDGEFGGSHTQAEITVCPKAIDLMIGGKKALRAKAASRTIAPILAKKS